MKRTKLNGQERAMLQHISDGKTPTEAASLAYNTTSKHSAQTISSRVMHRERFIKVLERGGLTDERLAKTAAKGLKAKRPLLLGQGKYKLFPDWQARHNFMKTGLQVKGLLSQEDKSYNSNDEPLIVRAIQFKTQIIKGKS